MLLEFSPKILILISAVVSFTLSGVIFRYSKRNKTNISFALFTFIVGFWAFCFYFYYSPIVFSQQDWIKIVYLISFLMIPPAVYFFACFPFRKIKSFFFPGLVYIILSIPLIWLLYFTNLWVKEVILYPWGPHTVTGPGYIFYFIFIAFVFSWGIYYLIQNYLSAKGILRTQLNFILFGLLLFGVPTIVVDFIFPIALGSSRYFWLSPIFALFFVGSTAYAVTRYRLMDIRIVISRGIVYFFSFVSIISFALLLLFLNSQLAQPISINIATSLILIIGILLFQPTFLFFKKTAAKYFYYTFYSYQQVLTDLGKKLTLVLELDKLSFLIVDTLIDIMKLERVVVLLREPGGEEYRIQKNIGFKEENGISLVKDNFLTIYLEKNQKPLVYEELSLMIKDAAESKEREKIEKLRENMKRIEASLCLPLFIEEKIIGMIVLGNKLSGESYSAEDINLLANLSNQASIALENARLYSRVEDLSKNLEKRVKEQVKQIEVLSEIKSEFLKIVNHQLRTPTTIIMGLLSMIQEGTIKGEEKIKKTINNAYLSSQRLITILDDILNAQELIGEKSGLNLKPSQIEDIISKVIEHFKFAGFQKNLTLRLEKPEKPSPQILLDQERIERALSKIIDNAILYTKKGGVTVATGLIRENKKDLIQIRVKDTGIGLTQEDKGKIFKLFSRGEGIKLHPNGSGLGLYIAKKYIEAHRGKIEVQSEGENKGSIFIITLPLISEV